MSFASQLMKFAGSLEKGSPHMLNAVGDHMFEEVRQRTPVDTGHCKSRWRKQEKSDSVMMTNDCEYAPALENGHSQQAPHGMMKLTVLHTKMLLKAGAIRW